MKTRGFTTLEALIALALVMLIAAIFVPIVWAEDRNIEILRQYLAKEPTEADIAAVAPFLLAPMGQGRVPQGQPFNGPRELIISPHPKLLREQVITERMQGFPQSDYSWVGRAAVGAIYDAETKRGSR